VNSNITWRVVTVTDSSLTEKILIAEGRISFMQIVTSDIDSVLRVLQRNPDPDRYIYTPRKINCISASGLAN
jgi:phage gp16-like protein